MKFFRFVISLQDIKMKKKRIKVVKTWPKPKSEKDK